MPPRSSLRPIVGPVRSFRKLAPRAAPSLCLFCSLTAGEVSRTPRARRKALPTRRGASTTATPTAAPAPGNAREELAAAMRHLRKLTASSVDLARAELALRNLTQQPGKESIRIAVLGVGGDSSRTAKKLLRLLLADPLQEEERWEKEVEDHDPSRPLIVRMGRIKEDDKVALAYARDTPVTEINVSSPAFNGNELEVLVMDMGPIDAAGSKDGLKTFEEMVLAPMVDIPISNTGAFTPIFTPVHKALFVGDGIKGAAAVMSLPISQDRDSISAAVNLKPTMIEGLSGYAFEAIDLDTASQSLKLFRESVDNAIEYETLWFKSNLAVLGEWLRSGTLSNEDAKTKASVRALIASVLRSISAAIQSDEAAALSAQLSSKVSPTALATLNEGLSSWAQSAHEELQTQLDAGFTGKRWRKLGWWKLFWRVDDVGLLSSEMLAKRFLPESERNLIYLAGRIREAGLAEETPDRPTYPGPPLAMPEPTPVQPPTPELEGKWPTHIAYTRAYVVDETIPALQALAQKLVVQSASTSAATTALATLMYVASFGAYEAGAVAALGLVWSLRRLQNKWETARSYWEGEVREEGRKAVRSAEASVAEVLDRSKREDANVGERMEELRRAKENVKKAEDALSRLE